jgi:gluconate 2-dehydrogenase gamma chain
MRYVGISPSRRLFLRRAVRAAPGTFAAVSGANSLVTVAAPSTSGGYKPSYFTGDEWSTLTAFVDRLIPHDAEGPGALEAGVAEFIDRQMATPYGYGKLWYMEGPFMTVSDDFGYQLPLNPRDLYRRGLAEFEDAVQKKTGKSFTAVTDVQKDELLLALEKGTLLLATIPARTFFGQVIQNTREGYFCDPKHGGNKNMAAWRMIGFPGARADYMDWVEQYGKKYPFPPVSSA